MIRHHNCARGVGAKGVEMSISRVFCLFIAHEPDRAHVEWKNGRFVGHCKRCGRSIYRISTRQWRPHKKDPA
ncbi:hypothetical protein [Novosphingobium aquimarinum]|uniref:hypothetical protein n=1 Tax=Novosphingobium aquimarinum TaxID=2682494 RepID=UPI0012EC497E|nr:hypothetical protein [Novosphingobium aquimarinum]